MGIFGPDRTHGNILESGSKGDTLPPAAATSQALASINPVYKPPLRSSTSNSSQQCVDNEGRLACSSPDLFHVAKALIKLGRHGGTPLHHAAGLGIRKIVSLLLDHTEYPFLTNDDCETAIDLGRQRGHAPVVRVIEHHIHKFCGWMWLFSGPTPEFKVAFGLLWVRWSEEGWRRIRKPRSFS
ncbi:hypothetical protein J5N97_013186 [Dioscorea zingiberensis]|uniref:Uncharacterized protein n=1 Tax=Dioscorea zingiberensis TaxID=325984 RepID=A0A9D5CSH2_9LILI|nr:hypothetical protein J5N97_013186 [Dioscorea zingiberensis]